MTMQHMIFVDSLVWYAARALFIFHLGNYSAEEVRLAKRNIRERERDPVHSIPLRGNGSGFSGVGVV